MHGEHYIKQPQPYGTFGFCPMGLPVGHLWLKPSITNEASLSGRSRRVFARLGKGDRVLEDVEKRYV